MMKNNILILILTVLTISCSNDSQTKQEKEEFDNQKQITSLTSLIIKPKVKLFSIEAEKLQKLTKQYVENLTISNLEKVKKQWKETAKKYEAIYAFDIGEIKDKYIRLRLNNWPSTNNAIENNILNKEVTSEVITNLGSSTKGLPGIEYLLFFEKSDATNSKMKKDKKRAKYLSLVVDELYENSKLQINLWNTYADYLIQNKKTDSEASFNLIFNGLNNAIHFAMETKIGKPAGIVKSYKYVNTEILQAYLSRTSLDLVKENIKSVENVFFNDKIISISDRIDFVTKNKELTNKLKAQFKAVNEAVEAIETPFVESLNNEKPKVKKLFEELKKLEVLFVVDVRSTLSLIITGTDGDGD